MERIKDIVETYIHFSRALWCVLIHLNKEQRKQLDRNEYVQCSKCAREFPVL